MVEKNVSTVCQPTTPYLIIIVGLLVVVAVLLAINLNKPMEFKPVVEVKPPQDLQRNALIVSGNAQLSVAPDQAVVYVSIITDDNKTAKGAQEKNRKTANAVLNAIKRWGANASDIETGTYSLTKLEGWDTEEGKYVEYGYRLTNTLNVTTQRINKLGGLIDASVAAGANGVESITFELSKKSEKKVREEALVKATKVAKQKGSQLASTAGVTLGKVISVQEQNFYYTPFEYNVKYSIGSAESAPTQISPAKVEVTSTVQLIFEIS